MGRDISVWSSCMCDFTLWASRVDSANPHTFWVQAPHVPGFQGVVGADLDLEFQDGVWETLKEKLVHSHVKSWDDFLQMVKKTKHHNNLFFSIKMKSKQENESHIRAGYYLWVTNELPVQLCIKGLHMQAVDVQHRITDNTDLKHKETKISQT